MKHIFQKTKQRKKAFTLVELLIVVGIIGILVVTLVVAVNFSTDKAKTSGINNILRTYETAASKAALQEAGFVDDLTQLANLLNKSLDSEFKVSVMNDVLTTSATDPWGQTIKIGYSKPEGTVGQLKFVSSGPDMKLGNADDIASTVTFKRNEGSGEVLVDHPENNTSHVHAYNQHVQSDEYMAQKGNCKTPSVYYVSCSCGDVGYETFNGVADPNNHVNSQVSYEYVNGEVHNTNKKCIDCGVTIETKEEPHVGDNVCSLCYGVIHTHAFNQTNIEEKFLYKAATCTSKAVYFYSCSCGNAGTETFEFGSVLAHDYTAQVISNGYLAENATCVQMAKYFYSCTMCGDKGTFTFNHGDFNRENHVGLTTYEYSRVDENQHIKNSICNACSNVKTSTMELHTMNEMNTCTLCGTHVHIFDKQIASDSYLRDSATCTSKATYFYSCECGGVGSEYFESGEMAPHTYTAEITEPEYLKSNATCINKSVYYKSCEFCGAKGTDTFEYGEVDSINHVGTTNVKYESISDTQHAKNTVCSSCNAVITSITEAHVFNANNDCTLCNNHVHVFDKQVVDTKYLKSAATCTAKAVYYYSCKCGEAGTTVFEYGNKTDHIFTAEVPSAEYLKTAATCIDKAVYYRSCTGCGLKGTTVFTVDGYDANNHVGVEIYAGTKEVHSKYSCCGATISTIHSYTQTTEIPATCIAMGTSRYTCDCTYTYTAVDISINPNNHVGEVVYGGTKDVHTKYNCCNATVSSTHTYDQNVVDDKYFASNANCVDKTAYYKSCKCGYSNKSTTFTVGNVDSSNHKGPEVYGGTKTCHIKCEACGATLQGEGYHEMKVVPGGTSATCTSDGAVIYSCDCGYGYTSIINKLGHAPATTPTWTSDHSKATVSCTRSGCTASWSGTSTEVTSRNATCTVARQYYHSVTINVNGTSKTFTCGTTHTGSALGHAPANTATWNSDHSTATVSCTRSGCTASWSGNSTVNVISNATCTSANKYNHKATFSVNGTTKTFTCPTTHSGSALGHLVSNPPKNITWSNDNKQVTIQCERSGCSQIWTYNLVEGDAEITDVVNPTCTTTGSYKCIIKVTIDSKEYSFKCPGHTTAALGHAPATTATWNSDHSKATVKCTRSGCSTTWFGNSTVNVISGATCTSANTYNHKATFSVNGTSKTFTCSETHTENALGHDFSSKSATSTYLKSRATCTDAAVYYYKCSRCTAKGTNTYTHGEALGHSPSTTPSWQTNHSYAEVKCTKCTWSWGSFSKEQEITAATCSVARTYCHSVKITVDGVEKTFTCGTHTGSTHSHSYAYSCDATCDCCGCTRTPLDHYMATRFVDDCTTPLVKHCAYGCGYEEIGSAQGHDFSNSKATYSWSADHKTCTATIVCNRNNICKYSITETKTATLTTVSNSTCTTQGKQQYVVSSWTNSTYFKKQACSDWHYLPLASHNFSSKTTTSTYLKNSATCTAAAVYYYKCSACTAKGTTTYTSGSALGHDYTSTYGSTEYLKSAATCTSPITYYYKCSRCTAKGTTTWTSGNALGHDYSVKQQTSNYLYSAATCTSSAVYYYKCSRCTSTSSNYKYSYGSALGHDYTKKTVTNSYLCTPANCTRAATYYYACSRSGCTSKSSSTYSSGSANGHSWTTLTAAGCGRNGLRKCGSCQTTQTIAATGNHTKPSGEKQYPTCTENVCCTVCNTEIYPKTNCCSVTYYYYYKNWYQLTGNCHKVEACAFGNRPSEGTCDKVVSDTIVKCKDQGSHTHR